MDSPSMPNAASNSPAQLEGRSVSLGQLVALFAILALSLFLRLAMVDMIEGTAPIRNDALEYYSYAVNMKHAGTYSSTPPTELTGVERTVVPDATRPPGYALFLYPFVTSPPTLEMVHSIRVAQVILSTLTVLLSFLVFREFLGNTWALVGTLLVGLSPHLISMNIYLLTETLFTFVLMLFAYLTIQGFARQSTVISILAGICLGLALLVKSSIMYFPYLLAIFIVAKYRSLLNYRVLLLFVLGFVIVQTPWVARNNGMDIASTGKPKALVSLQNGSYPGLMYNDDPSTRGIPHRADPGYGDIQGYGDFFRDLTDKASDDPVKYVQWYVLGKLQMMLSWSMVAGAGDIFVYAVDYSPYTDRQPFVLTHSVMKTLHPAIMAFAMLGMLLAVFRNGALSMRNADSVSLLLLGTIALYFVALHVVVTPLPRYMIPLRPVLYGLALYCMSYLVDRILAKYALRGER